MVGYVPHLILGRFCVGVSFCHHSVFLPFSDKTIEKTDEILSKVRFLLYSQYCILRKTFDLLDFMLHRVLFTAVVKILCCHNVIPPKFGGELTKGCIQLYIQQLNLKRTLSLNPYLHIKLVLTLTVDITIQLELRKRVKNQNWDEKFYNVTNFEVRKYMVSDFKKGEKQRV